MSRGRFAPRAVRASLLFVLFGVLCGAAQAGPHYTPLLWIGARHTLVRVSAHKGDVLSTVEVGPHKPEAVGTDAVTGDAWVLQHETLSAYDRTGALLHKSSLPHRVVASTP